MTNERLKRISSEKTKETNSNNNKPEEGKNLIVSCHITYYIECPVLNIKLKGKCMAHTKEKGSSIESAAEKAQMLELLNTLSQLY